MSATLAALVLGITEGPSWGWSSGRVVACFVGAVVVGAAFLRRSARHPEPVLDLTLFRSRSFSVANAATVLYAMGFFAMLLGQHPVPHERLALLHPEGGSGRHPRASGGGRRLGTGGAAGPADRVPHRPAGRLRRLRRRAWAGTPPWSASTLRTWHAGCRQRSITGLGIGLTFPVLSAAAVSSLHIERFAVGSAVNQTARQVGGAFGVALLVVILGTPRTRSPRARQLPPPLGVRRHHGRSLRARVQFSSEEGRRNPPRLCQHRRSPVDRRTWQ